MVKKTKFIERIPCFLAAGMLFFAACNGMEENLENNQNGEDNGGSDVETPVEPTDSLPSLAAFSVEMEEITAVTAKIKFTVGNKVAASYHVTTEPEGNPAPAVIAKKGTKVSFTDSTYTVSLTDLNAETTYYWYVVTETTAGKFDTEVLNGTFNTLSFNYTELLTILEHYHDGFRAHVTVPDYVKADTSRAIRYVVSTLPLYLQKRQDPDFNDFDAMEQNGQMFLRADRTLIFNDDNQYVDEQGNPVPEEEYEATVDIQLHDKFAPGEPVVFMAGEFTTRESNYGWGWGYYQPVFDTLSYWHTNPPQLDVFASPWVQAQNSDPYWTGAFQKQIVRCNLPEPLDGDIHMEVIEKNAIDATLRLTPTDNVVQYCVSVIDDGTYQQLLPLINNNEDYLQWYFTSIYAFMSGTAVSLYGPTDLKLSDCVYVKGDQSKFRVYVVGMGNEEGTTQFFKRLDDVTTTEYSLPLPVIKIRPVNSGQDYYSVTFNIKAPNKDLKSAVFACHYSREFEKMLNAGNSYNAITEGGMSFSATEIAMINSDEGYTITFDSVPGEVTRLAVLGTNAENRTNKITRGDVADCATANRPRKPTVNTDYYQTLPGEWTANVRIESFYNTEGKYEYDDETGEYRKFIHDVKEKVTICREVTYPSPMPQEVYAYYPNDKKTTVDSLYNRFVECADKFNEYELKRQNRLLCIGFCNHGLGLRSASPWELFISKDYVGYDVEGIFYDFGPKWFLEMLPNADYSALESVVVPYNSVRMAPFSNWDRYEYYMFPYSPITNKAFTSTGESGTEDGQVPVEISEDSKTITVKSVQFGGYDYYLTPMYMRYGEPQSSFSVVDEIVLTKGWDGTQTANTAKSASVKNVRRVSASNIDGTESVYNKREKTALKSMTPLKVNQKKEIEYKKANFKVPTAESFAAKMKEIAEKYY